MGTHRFRRGLRVPISGAPEQTLDDAAAPGAVAVVAADYPGMKPAMHVSPGDAVRRGQLLFEDRKQPGVPIHVACGGHRHGGEPGCQAGPDLGRRSCGRLRPRERRRPGRLRELHRTSPRRPLPRGSRGAARRVRRLGRPPGPPVRPHRGAGIDAEVDLRDRDEQRAPSRPKPTGSWQVEPATWNGASRLSPG